jgi:hypothetical protein
MILPMILPILSPKVRDTGGVSSYPHAIQRVDVGGERMIHNS